MEILIRSGDSSEQGTKAKPPTPKSTETRPAIGGNGIKTIQNMKRSRSADPLTDPKSGTNVLDTSPSKVRILEDIRVPLTATHKLVMIPSTVEQIPNRDDGNDKPATIKDVPELDNDGSEDEYGSAGSHTPENYDLTLSDEEIVSDVIPKNSDPVNSGDKAKETPPPPNPLQEILLAMSLDNGITRTEMEALQQNPIMQYFDSQVNAMSNQIGELLKGVRGESSKKTATPTAKPPRN